MTKITAAPCSLTCQTGVRLLEYDYLSDYTDHNMGAYSIAEAKAHLSALVEQVIRGEAVTLTRRGKPVARIVPTGELMPKPKLDLAALRKFRAGLPKAAISSAEMVRNMRDQKDGW